MIRIEERREQSLVVKIATKIIAVLLALGISAVIFASYGINPVYAFSIMFSKSLSSYGLSEVVIKFIPLELCGIGLIVAFKSGMWNIGAEGQLLIGAIMATWAALFLDIPDFTRLPLILVLSMIGGMSWALIPAFLKAKLEVNEVIVTLMMNYIASFLVNYLVYGPWKGAKEWGFPYTDKFPESAWLPIIPGTRIHWPTLLMASIAASMTFLIMFKTTLGFEMRVCGQSRKVAEYSGMNYAKALMVSMAISGALAGLAGAGEVCGIHRRLRYASAISSGYGYSGIIVAWLSGLHPAASLFSALFMAFLLAGGDILQVSLGLPLGVVNVFNGVILFSLLLSEFFGRYRLRWR
ncbi:MAG: ABC transporter permease [Candidatus Bathyarchaeia archaeon]